MVDEPVSPQASPEKWVQRLADAMTKFRDGLQGTEDRVDRQRLFADYVLDVFYVLRDIRKSGDAQLYPEVGELVGKLEDGVRKGAPKSLQDLAAVILDEVNATARPLSPSDDQRQFWDWVWDHVLECRDEVFEADGVGEKIRIVYNCVGEIIERGIEQV